MATLSKFFLLCWIFGKCTKEVSSQKSPHKPLLLLLHLLQYCLLLASLLEESYFEQVKTTIIKANNRKKISYSATTILEK